MPSDEAPLVLGKVAGAWGIQGWIKIHAFGDDPLAWRKMPKLWLKAEGAGDEADTADNWVTYKLIQLRMQGSTVVAYLEGVADRTAAEAMKGQLIGAPRAALPPTDPNEYYWTDLIGLAVHNEQGIDLGTVTELMESGANAVMSVTDAEGNTRLLPFVGEIVKTVDRAAGRMVVAWEAEW